MPGDKENLKLVLIQAVTFNAQFITTSRGDDFFKIAQLTWVYLNINIFSIRKATTASNQNIFLI